MSVLDDLIQKGVLVSPSLLDKSFDDSLIEEVINHYGDDLEVLDEKLINDFKKNEPKNSIKIIKNYTKPSSKRSFQDFVKVFQNRFDNISSMLKNRQELRGVASISNVKKKSPNETVTIIGMVKEKQYTKNNNIILEMEDKTDLIKAIIKKDDESSFSIANDIVLDEIIGIIGVMLGDAIFVKEFVFPDIPLSKELKKQREEEYVIFMGDQHFGSNVFLKEAYQKFNDWLNGKIGSSEQKELASKVKYLVMTGDLIEGAGIYPNQEDDLDILDVKEQYELTAHFLKKVPSHIQMVTTLGNHDVGRIAEPQPPIPKDYAKELHEIPNLKIVSNPAYVTIGKTDEFPGFDVLLYHGGSLIYYSENIPSIRAAGGQKRVDLILEFLLKRRHLAPTHGSTLIIPDAEEDFLLIDKIPDFFATGHIHRTSVSNYKNITCINTSAWTETTEDQIKRGLEPQPGRIILVNLKTREVKVMNFLSKEQQLKELKEQNE